jgi:hypothetical protein
MNLKGLIFVLTVIVHLRATAQFKEGYYYGKDGTKVSGLINLNCGGNAFTDKSDGDCSIVFKRDKKGERLKLTTNDICCFVINADSFAIVKNFKLNAFVTYPQDFAKVIGAGRINLFLYYSTVTSAGQYGGTTRTVTDWIIEKDGQADKLTRKRFKELMPEYLADFPELLDKVTTKKLSYDDTEKIVEMYNTYMRTDSLKTP